MIYFVLDFCKSCALIPRKYMAEQGFLINQKYWYLFGHIPPFYDLPL